MPTPLRPRIIVIDDHPLIRAGVIAQIDTDAGFEVVGEACDAAEARELTLRLRPDLAILDLKLGKDDGLVLLRELRWHHPRLRVVVLTMLARETHAARALLAGAHAFLHKEADGAQLLTSLRDAMSRSVMAAPHESLPVAAGSGLDPLPCLSDRELQVFTLIGQGHTNREIAANLGLSPRTIETHKEHIKERLGETSVAQLTARAARWVAANHPDS